jgi:hypothetical protein
MVVRAVLMLDIYHKKRAEALGYSLKNIAGSTLNMNAMSKI